jgi:hypothetical protein
MRMINKPEVSRSIALVYVGVAVFIVVIAVVLLCFGLPLTNPAGIFALALLVVVEAITLSILASIYRTEYVLEDNELVLKASLFIGGNKRIALKTVKSVEKTLIPFGFRLFGASFYGGHCYIPSIGRVFAVITNFRDGILIRAQDQTYLITPKNPEDFARTIRERIQS